MGKKDKRGGARPGSGRKAPDGVRLAVTISLTPEVKNHLDELCESLGKSKSLVVEELIKEKRED